MIGVRCGGDVVSQEMNDHHEPFMVFRRHHTRPNQLFVSSFKYLGIVLSLAGDRGLAEARACVEGTFSLHNSLETTKSTILRVRYRYVRHLSYCTLITQVFCGINHSMVVGLSLKG